MESIDRGWALIGFEIDFEDKINRIFCCIACRCERRREIRNDSQAFWSE